MQTFINVKSSCVSPHVGSSQTGNNFHLLNRKNFVAQIGALNTTKTLLAGTILYNASILDWILITFFYFNNLFTYEKWRAF